MMRQRRATASKMFRKWVAEDGGEADGAVLLEVNQHAKAFKSKRRHRSSHHIPGQAPGQGMMAKIAQQLGLSNVGDRKPTGTAWKLYK